MTQKMRQWGASWEFQGRSGRDFKETTVSAQVVKCSFAVWFFGKNILRLCKLYRALMPSARHYSESLANRREQSYHNIWGPGFVTYQA